MDRWRHKLLLSRLAISAQIGRGDDPSFSNLFPHWLLFSPAFSVCELWRHHRTSARCPAQGRPQARSARVAALRSRKTRWVDPGGLVGLFTPRTSEGKLLQFSIRKKKMNPAIDALIHFSPIFNMNIVSVSLLEIVLILSLNRLSMFIY